MIEQASLVIGEGNWAVKSDSLLGYKINGGKYYPREMSVVRATTGTRINEDGLVEVVPYNLFTYSEQINDSSWTKVAVTVTADTATAPDGTLTADKIIPSTTSTNHRVVKTITSGLNNTISIFAKADGYDKLFIGWNISQFNQGILFDLTNGIFTNAGSIFTASIENYGNGWYRCSVTALPYPTTFANFSVLNNLNQLIFTGDGTSGVLLWGAQLVEGTQPLDYLPTTDRLDVARIDYSSGSAALLVEPQRTNTILNSVLSGTTSLPTSWNFSISTGTSAPTPSIYSQIGQAYSFTTSATRQAIFQNQSYTSGSSYSFSVFVESVTGSIRVDNVIFQTVAGTQTFYKDGVLINGSDFVESGHRYTTLMVASSTTTAQVRIGNGTGGPATGTVVLSMPQVEVGSYATSYIPTQAATVTRNADVISKTGIADLIGQTEGTLFAEVDINASANGRIIAIDTGSLANFINIILDGNFIFRIAIRKNTGTIVTIISGAVGVLGANKMALSYENGDYKFFLNGVLAGSSNNSTDYPVGAISRMVLSDTAYGASDYRNSQAALWQTRLTNAQLAQLTSI